MGMVAGERIKNSLYMVLIVFGGVSIAALVEDDGRSMMKLTLCHMPDASPMI